MRSRHRLRLRRELERCDRRCVASDCRNRRRVVLLEHPHVRAVFDLFDTVSALYWEQQKQEQGSAFFLHSFFATKIRLFLGRTFSLRPLKLVIRKPESMRLELYHENNVLGKSNE